jgi:hypothetical protein
VYLPLDMSGALTAHRLLVRPSHQAARTESQALGPSQLLDRTEVTRLLLDALQSLGHTAAALALEKESGVALHRPQAASLRQGVLSGDWTQADDALDGLSPRDGDADAHLAARWLLRRQKLVEVLQGGDLAAALALLRSDLAPLPVPPAALHATAAVLLCTSPEQLVHALAEADSSWGMLQSASPVDAAPVGVEQARAQVLARITRLLSPADVVSPRRLEALLEQALQAQVQGCLFHNQPLHAVRPSLLRDYTCGPEHLPTVCCAVLRAHGDEVRPCTAPALFHIQPITC